MKDGFIKVAAAAPEMRLADCAYNAKKIAEADPKLEMVEHTLIKEELSHFIFNSSTIS